MQAVPHNVAPAGRIDLASRKPSPQLPLDPRVLLPDVPLRDDRSAPQRKLPTVWGLDPIQLHDRFWAARGVFVVRLGEQTDIPHDAELFMLTDPRTLTVFRLSRIVDRMSWMKPAVMFIRLQSKLNLGYREIVVADPEGKFLGFRRLYGGVLPRLARVAFTKDWELARLWQASFETRTAWRELRRRTSRERHDTVSVKGRAYDRGSDEELNRFVLYLIESWRNPTATLSQIRKVAPQVWAHRDAHVAENAKFIGPAWIGAGRTVPSGANVLGPAALWDDPARRPQGNAVVWSELEPSPSLAMSPRQRPLPNARKVAKRLFDIVFSFAVLLVTLPLYPLVMIAIWLEDGRPFFFAHKRETIGGRTFGCLKFRSMRKDAEQIKAQIQSSNQSDGPQFYMRNDPRLTRVGKFIRKYNIDELPQFINVLLGQMSVVGPRPSPHMENQFCPAWRDARLSVRPGVTGLWQVRRTRAPGLDFQEWIKYDLEYVQHGNWRMDLAIIIKTFRVLLWG